MHAQVEFIKTHPYAVVPSMATSGSAGLDLTSVDAVCIKPGERALVNTGLNIALEDGFEGQVRSRSGLALKHGIAVLNSPGTIDADYRGSVGVILINLGSSDFYIQPGDRIAQLVVKPVCTTVDVKLVSEFSNPSTARGAGGYGSTGR